MILNLKFLFTTSMYLHILELLNHSKVWGLAHRLATIIIYKLSTLLSFSCNILQLSILLCLIFVLHYCWEYYQAALVTGYIHYPTSLIDIPKKINFILKIDMVVGYKGLTLMCICCKTFWSRWSALNFCFWTITWLNA